ncbi:tetratricopeptide repeat protein [Vibrio astriarenae]
MKKTLMFCVATLLSFASAAQSTDSVPQSLDRAPDQQQEPMADMAQLSYQAQDTRLSVDERAQALRSLGQYPSQNGVVAVARALKDDNAQLREAAIIGAAPYQLPHRWKMLEPLLSDEVKSVRLSAVMSLLPDYTQLDTAQRNTISSTTQELLDFLPSQKDLESQLMLADTLRWTGEHQKAEQAYAKLLETAAERPEVWLNYSDNYRAQNKDQEAIDILDQAILALPKNGDFYYAKSLALVRLEKRTAAAEEMEKATKLSPDNSYYWFLNGVLQEPIDINHSIHSFETAYMLSGSSEHLYSVCDIYVRHGHTNSEVCLEALEQHAPAYVIEQLRAQMPN